MSDWSRAVAGPVILREDAVVDGLIDGDVMVLGGATLELGGAIVGDLMVEVGGRAVVRGSVGGAIRNRGGHVQLYGTAGSVVEAAPGSVTIVETSRRPAWPQP